MKSKIKIKFHVETIGNELATLKDIDYTQENLMNPDALLSENNL